MKIAMTEANFEVGHSLYPVSQTITESNKVGDVFGTVSNR